jgi:prepilin-type processing-associated H-X9-DG protein
MREARRSGTPVAPSSPGSSSGPAAAPPPHIPDRRDRSRNRLATRGRAAFTLTELLVVIGLLAMLLALLLPVMVKARSASHSAKCLANLREMGCAWTAYTLSSRGALPPYFWRTTAAPEYSWNSYWLGILDAQGIRGESVMCPSASEPNNDVGRLGYGTASLAWTGKFSPTATPVRLTATTYRDGSYGYNYYLFAASGGWGEGGRATKLTAVHDTSNVPLFFDSVWVHACPPNHDLVGGPADPPPNLRGDQAIPGDSEHEHWDFLIARHGRGINIAMADGSARWVRLEDTYLLTWKNNWDPYPIPLPSR